MPLLSLLGLTVPLIAGFVLLAMSQDQHRRAVGARSLTPSARTTRRVIGYALLIVTLPLAIWRDGPGFGTLVWMILSSASACAVTVALSWKPRWLSPLARGKAGYESRHTSSGVDP